LIVATAIVITAVIVIIITIAVTKPSFLVTAIVISITIAVTTFKKMGSAIVITVIYTYCDLSWSLRIIFIQLVRFGPNRYFLSPNVILTQ